MALEISYLGWDYHGFAAQADSENTIEVRTQPSCDHDSTRGLAASLIQEQFAGRDATAAAAVSAIQ